LNGSAVISGRNSPPAPKVRRYALLLPVAVALCFRLWGIGWGLPERTDLHPDEIHYVIGHAMTVSWSDPDPRFLNYPSFLTYSTALAHGLLKAAGIVHHDWQISIVGRSISAVYGALTCAVVFLLAEQLGAALPAAFLAALWVSILPLHVWESHVAVTDVMMTFWVMVTLYGSVRLIRHGRPLDYVLTGAALGLAVGSKYTAALAGVAPVVALLVGRRPLGESVRGLVLLGLSAIAACFVVTPYSFLHFGELLKAMAYENAHVHGHHSGFSLPAAGWQYHKYLYQVAAAWPFSFGLPLYLCAAAGAVWAIARWKREYAVVLSFAVLFFGITGSWTFTPLRYYLPVVVLGALLAGLWQGDWLMSPVRLKRGFAAVVIASTLCYTLAFTYSTTARYAHDTRIQAAEWLRGQAASFGEIWLAGDTAYLATLPGTSNISSHTEGGVLKYLSINGGNGAPDLLEITSLHYLRWYRHGNEHYMNEYDQLRSGRSGYVLLKRFEADFLNKRLYIALDPMFEGYFISPTLEFYQRAGAG
jgi:4-amino-4-deoxy-L-arabinose transferase-like glycosyltransferase